MADSSFDTLGNRMGRTVPKPRHPKTPAPTVGEEQETASAVDQVAEQAGPVSAPSEPVSSPASQRPARKPARRREPEPVPVPEEPEKFERFMAFITPAQAQWLKSIRKEAMLDDDEVSASAVVRLALETLRRRGGWDDLRAELMEQGSREHGRGRPRSAR